MEVGDNLKRNNSNQYRDSPKVDYRDNFIHLTDADNSSLAMHIPLLSQEDDCLFELIKFNNNED